MTNWYYFLYLGARVILACRDLTRAERAADDIRKSTGNGNVVVYQLDLASLKSIRKCADEVKSKEKRLDILINNAGKIQILQYPNEFRVVNPIPAPFLQSTGQRSGLMSRYCEFCFIEALELISRYFFSVMY